MSDVDGSVVFVFFQLFGVCWIGKYVRCLSCTFCVLNRCIFIREYIPTVFTYRQVYGLHLKYCKIVWVLSEYIVKGPLLLILGYIFLPNGFF